MSNNEYSIDGYLIEIKDIPLEAELEINWTSIQNSQFSTPFFLSWEWISTWIDTCSPELISVSASVDGQVVSIGLFTLSDQIRHGVVKSRQLRLHQTGDQLLDQIWIEYNDFISLDEHRETARKACLQALHHKDNQWDEIIISMMPVSRALEITSKFDNAHIIENNPCYAANLYIIESSSENYLQYLKRNTRYQIRRSMRGYENTYGKITLVEAQNTNEAIDFFREAGVFHKERWPDSGFKNSAFTTFHERLISKYFNCGSIDLLKVISGDQTIAIMYYQILDQTVYFYLQGVFYEPDSKLKPGLVSHSLASQHYLDRGMKIYDYMGGYSQYKSQLAQRTEDLATVCIQREKLMFKLEKIARSIKRIFQPLVNPPGNSARPE